MPIIQIMQITSFFCVSPTQGHLDNGRVSQMFFPVKNFPDREIHASGRGLVYADAAFFEM